eukprot:TRINITY_DN1557_c0_g1_i1.p1 TRINITY_DN1557_c0_g1~~TRINITY_DN1557_c0_g1_i1.p1  ORF type:complete len:449 (+),score=105.85 TRINITY_DN1557_c0_g1_i1:554-1900(+)
MDGSQSSSGPAPFLTKTYEMVDDSSTNSVVSWSQNNNSFIVWNQMEFSRDLLPKYFKHSNFSSFVRQLNTYGFRKIDPDRWEFANDEFLRGQRHLLKNIYRRKPIHSHSQQHNQAQGSSSGVLSEAEKQELEDEIEKLKRDRNVLLLEMQQHTQQQRGMDLQMQSLEERLHLMELRQRQMMAFLKRIAQKPGFLSNLMEQSETYNKKRRLPKPDYFYDEVEAENNRIMASHTAAREKTDVISVQLINMEPFEKMESSINSWENFFRGVSRASGEEMYSGGMPCQLSAVVLTEMDVSSGDPGINLRPPSPKLRSSSPPSRDSHSSPELTESTSYLDSPSSSPIQVHGDILPKASGIDVNTKPAATEVQSSKEHVNVPYAAVTGVNDMFWEQFLTEHPGSMDAEVQSEGRDTDGRRSENKPADHGNFWWNRKNVDHLTEQMGQLTPAEST